MHHLLWNNVNYILRCEFNMMQSIDFICLVSFMKSSLYILSIEITDSNQFRECLVFFSFNKIFLLFLMSNMLNLYNGNANLRIFEDENNGLLSKIFS